MVVTIFIIILVIIWFAFIYFDYKKPTLFDRYQRIVEFSLIIISLLFALVTIQQTNTSIESSTEDFNKIITRIESIISKISIAQSTLDSLEENLTELPSQINKFSASITSLDSIVAKQTEKLDFTLTSLESSITHFKGSVDQMTERFNRKPDIELGIDYDENDSTVIIKTLAVTNKGSLLADIFTIRIHIPNNQLIKFDFGSFYIEQEYENYSTYQLDLSSVYVVPSKNKPRVFRGNIILDKYKTFNLDFFVYYRSDFGNDGVSQLTFHHLRPGVNSVNKAGTRSVP